MLQVKVIGIGAAGNKAAIKLIEDKVYSSRVQGHGYHD